MIFPGAAVVRIPISIVLEYPVLPTLTKHFLDVRSMATIPADVGRYFVVFFNWRVLEDETCWAFLLVSLGHLYVLSGEGLLLVP